MIIVVGVETLFNAEVIVVVSAIGKSQFCLCRVNVVAAVVVVDTVIGHVSAR